MTTEERLHILVSAYLLDLGFLYRTSGYKYIRDSIILQNKHIYNDKSSSIEALPSKVMLAEVGKVHKVNASAVYSSMRTTLNKAYRKGNQEKFQKLFPETPLVMDFIQMVAERIGYGGASFVPRDALLKYLRHFQHTEKSRIPPLCPCCGEETMNPNLYRNYISRVYEALLQRVYVCPDCHKREETTIIPIKKWSYIKQLFEGGER